MGLDLTTDRYPPIMSQTCYPLHHAASNIFELYFYVISCAINFLITGFYLD